MCGIVGYVGTRDATPILLEGLRRLEYRGYDSAGVAVMNGHGGNGGNGGIAGNGGNGGNGSSLIVRKLAGRVQGLCDDLDREPLSGATGIAHTRWATHGAPTTTNAHPHVDCTGDIAVLTPDGYHIIDSEAHVQLRAVSDIAWDLQAIELGGYAHFMLKEISEQAETVRSTLRGRLLFGEGGARLNGLNLSPEQCAA